MGTRSVVRFNPPENWPVPANFEPPEGWKPDSAWGPLPPGWPLWITYEHRSNTVRNVVLGITGLALFGLFLAAVVAVLRL